MAGPLLAQGANGQGYRNDPDGAAANHLIPVISPTLTASMGSNAGHPGESGKDEMVLAVATAVMGDRSHTLTAEGADASEDGSGRGTPVVAIDLRNAARESGAGAGTQGDGWKVGGPSYTLSATHRALPGVTVETGVRRLTPLECERLQGYPDGWTATSWGKPQADSPRYRQLGNSVAVPCIEWIARRVVRVDQANVSIPPGQVQP